MDTSTDTMPPERLHVLVVDDDELIRYLVAEFLTHNGHTVDTADNGQEGWEKFQARRFQAVILDWRMPGIRGDHLAVLIKQAAPATRVVMITGSDTRRLVAEGPVHEIDVLLPKPFTWTALEEALLEKVAQGVEREDAPYMEYLSCGSDH